jgi:hypothetical protein
VSDLVPVLKFVRLPDGRWATENGEGVENVSRDDIEAMHNVWLLWANLRWQRAGETDASE